jgi:hypothetical protein
MYMFKRTRTLDNDYKRAGGPRAGALLMSGGRDRMCEGPVVSLTTIPCFLTSI